MKAFEIPLTWTELVKRTIRETSADNCLGLAAQLAYYFLLALVPAIVFVAALASFFPARVINDMLASLSGLVPPDVVEIVRNQLEAVAGGSHAGVLTFGLLMALWSSSAALVGITDALNRAYDIEEGRPWWKVRLTAIALTVGLAIFVLAAFTLVMLGPTLADWLAERTGVGSAFAITWKVVQWPIVMFLIVMAVGLINYVAPDAEQDWVWVTPGAVLATVLWLISSLAFKVYLASFADYNQTYGSLGGVIVLMLWFYMSALAILVGAEMNAEIEHASPYGKDPGEKVPGTKKKLGAAAARAYDQRHGAAAALPPAPRLDPRPARPAARAFGTYSGGLIYLVTRLFRRVKD